MKISWGLEYERRLAVLEHPVEWMRFAFVLGKTALYLSARSSQCGKTEVS
jgi:hypothetical protein